jgi:HSP20 family protein
MTLVKWTPRNREMDTMYNTLDSMMRGFFDDRWLGAPALQSEWVPSTDIIEEENRYLVSLDLPGMLRENIKISVQNGTLSVRGERKNETKDSGKGYSRIERSYGTFMRTFTLPNTIDGKNIDASYKDGVLRLTLPKVEEARPKEIEVKVH